MLTGTEVVHQLEEYIGQIPPIMDQEAATMEMIVMKTMAIDPKVGMMKGIIEREMVTYIKMTATEAGIGTEMAETMIDLEGEAIDMVEMSIIEIMTVKRVTATIGKVMLTIIIQGAYNFHTVV